MNMIERVARALCEQEGGPPSCDEACGECRASARAAIEAMHEPTEEMMSVGMGGAEGVKRSVLQLMIDAALSESAK